MDCRQASAMMSLRLDGRIDSAEDTALDEHLVACGSCRAEWEAMQALDTLFHQATLTPAPVALQASVMAHIRRRDQTRWAITAGLILALGSAAIGALAIPSLMLSALNDWALLPVLITVGPEIVILALTYLIALGHTASVVLEIFAAPIGLVATSCLVAGLVLNYVLVGAVRRTNARLRNTTAA